jgi:hypothetical protein
LPVGQAVHDSSLLAVDATRYSPAAQPVVVVMVVLHAVLSAAAFQLVPSTQAVQVLSVCSAVAWAAKPSPTGQVAVRSSQELSLAVANLPVSQAVQTTSCVRPAVVSAVATLLPSPALAQTVADWASHSPVQE